MDEQVSPMASGLSWTVDLTDPARDFIGRKALEMQQQRGQTPRFVGLVLAGKGILREHQVLLNGEQPVGEVTSGGFSPTLQRSIGLARVAADTQDEQLMVAIRRKQLPVQVVQPPFARKGKALIQGTSL